MAPGPFFVPIQRVLILAAADACHRYKEKLKLLLSDYQVKAEPWLFEHRGKPIVNEAIGDLANGLLRRFHLCFIALARRTINQRST